MGMNHGSRGKNLSRGIMHWTRLLGVRGVRGRNGQSGTTTHPRPAGPWFEARTSLGEIGNIDRTAVVSRYESISDQDHVMPTGGERHCRQAPAFST